MGLLLAISDWLVRKMKSDPVAVLQKLRTMQVDPDSTAFREMVEEVAERVLRNLTPEAEPLFPLAKPKAPQA
jgi:hypothetical protein